MSYPGFPIYRYEPGPPCSLTSRKKITSEKSIRIPNYLYGTQSSNLSAPEISFSFEDVLKS